MSGRWTSASTAEWADVMACDTRFSWHLGYSPKEVQHMRDQGKSALIMAALAVVAVVAAPAADARPGCDQTDGTMTCQTNGSVSIEAESATMVPVDWRNMIPWQTGSRRTYGGRQ